MSDEVWILEIEPGLSRPRVYLADDKMLRSIQGEMARWDPVILDRTPIYMFVDIVEGGPEILSECGQAVTINGFEVFCQRHSGHDESPYEWPHHFQNDKIEIYW